MYYTNFQCTFSAAIYAVYVTYTKLLYMDMTIALITFKEI